MYRRILWKIQIIMALSWLWPFLPAIATATPLSPPPPIDTALLPPVNLTSYPWRCWQDPHPRVNPTTAPDCRLVAERVQRLSQDKGPLTFGTNNNPSIDFVLPMALTVVSCKIRLLPLNSVPFLSDKFTLRYLAHSINRMALQCIEHWPHNGGEGEVGPKGVIGLVVGGTIKPKDLVVPGRIVIEQGISRKIIII